MERDSRNIYKTARDALGLSQERWAALIGVSPDSVRLYESGRGLPSDPVVMRMEEATGMQVLCYWHMRESSGIANDVLPEVPELPLAQAVIRMLNQIRAFETRHRGDALMDIADDGRVDELEAENFSAILGELDGIIKAALQVKYAETKPKNER